MKNKDRKKIQRELAHESIDYFFSLLNKSYSREYQSYYIKEILDFATSFNIRLSKREKGLFCKKCYTYFNLESDVKTRIESKTKTRLLICSKCGNTRRFKL